MEYDIGDWESLSGAFEDMFEGLGEVESDESKLEFTSFPSDVATGISLSRDGSMLANMPLHGIDSRFERVILDDRREQIRLIGPSIDYTYRVPPAILKRRGRLRGLSRLWRLR
tara:strand:- start:233 stop:571 length:339 start_codon:yes stop_codon:yes gene_type:complete